MSVLDIGCGVGTWVKAWKELGVRDVLGVDGDYVDRQMLECAEEEFNSHNLTQSLALGRRYDLVTCLEVAEHLPSSAAPTLVASLTRHADVIMFSAAVPKQGGTHHVNEQWPSYWVPFFEEHGYRPYDVIRSVIWHSEAVEWWYRQNIILFATDSAASRLGLRHVDAPLDIAHPAFLEATTAPVPLSEQGRTWLKAQAKRVAAFTGTEEKLAGLRTNLRGALRSRS